MQITIVSNFYNHHQSPWISELANFADVCFVATEPTPQDRINMGYDDSNHVSTVFNSYINEADYLKAIKLINDSDVVVYGSCPFEMVKERISRGKLTFRYSERLFKKSPLLRFHPNMKRMVKSQCVTNANDNYYLLSAGYYASKDYNKLGAFNGKAYKWGYFPAVSDSERTQKTNDKLKILYCGRMLKWKHPKLAVKGYAKLLKSGLDCELTMIGLGEIYEEVIRLADRLKLKSRIKFIPSVPYYEVNNYMAQADIFMFTSDRNEGWGAVLNESMGGGCSVIANKKIGSVPYLMQNGVNGYIYSSKKDFYCKLLKLASNENIRLAMSTQARNTISNMWCPQTAGKRFYEMCNSILKGQIINFEDGVLSKTSK